MYLPSHPLPLPELMKHGWDSSDNTDTASEEAATQIKYSECPYEMWTRSCTLYTVFYSGYISHIMGLFLLSDGSNVYLYMYMYM